MKRLAFIVAGLLAMGHTAFAGPFTSYAIFGAGTVTIGKSATVAGDVASGGNVLLHDGATVQGAVTENAPVAPPPATAFSSGSKAVTIGRHKTYSLLPGTYGTLAIEKSGVLNLSAGDYYLDSLTADKQVTLNLDLSNGGINIYVANDATFAGLTTNLNGGSAANVYAQIGGHFRMDQGGSFSGTIYTPNGDISARDAVFTGALISGGNVDLGKDSELTFVPSNHGPTASVPTPEPGTLIGLSTVLGVGLLYGWRRRWPQGP